jgi:hypothetical protein
MKKANTPTGEIKSALDQWVKGSSLENAMRTLESASRTAANTGKSVKEILQAQVDVAESKASAGIVANQPQLVEFWTERAETHKGAIALDSIVSRTESLQSAQRGIDRGIA